MASRIADLLIEHGHDAELEEAELSAVQTAMPSGGRTGNDNPSPAHLEEALGEEDTQGLFDEDEEDEELGEQAGSLFEDENLEEIDEEF